MSVNLEAEASNLLIIASASAPPHDISAVRLVLRRRCYMLTKY